MLKERLETHNIQIRKVDMYEYKIENDFYVGFNKEEASLQYIKENGFKLSWLLRKGLNKKRLLKLFGLNKKITKELMHNLWEIGYEYQLIALLYAHGIKLINDLEG